MTSAAAVPTSESHARHAFARRVPWLSPINLYLLFFLVCAYTILGLVAAVNNRDFPFSTVLLATTASGVALAVPLIAFLIVVERRHARSLPGWLPYLGVLVVTPLAFALDTCLSSLIVFQGSLPPMTWKDVASLTLENALIVGLLIAVWMHQRQAQQLFVMLRATQLEQTHVARRTSEARLEALQARVEPRFLFESLDTVQRHFVDNPRVAAQLLDDLIAFLRAVLPTRETSVPTLDHEIALLRTYLAIRGRSGAGFPVVRIDDSGTVGEARFPPFVLVPLVQAVLDTGTGAVPEAIELTHSAVDGTLRLTLSVASGSAAGFPELRMHVEAVSSRLTELHPGGAGIHFRELDGGRVQIAVEVPHETA